MLFVFLVLQIIAAVVCTEALTELVVKSEFFHPLRKFLFESDFRLLNYIHRIFDCGYCFSVWAAGLSMYLIFYLSNLVTYSFVFLLVVHRLSNLFHFIMDAVRDKSSY